MAMVGKRFFANNYHNYPGELEPLDASAWKSWIVDIINTITTKVTPSSSSCDGGLYVGLGGIAYALHYVSSHPAFAEKRENYRATAAHFLEKQIQYDQTLRDESSDVSFLLGKLGTYAVASVVAKAAGNENDAQKWLQQYINVAQRGAKLKLSCGSDELFVGRAGILTSAKWLESQFQSPVLPQETLQALCDAVIDSGYKYSFKYQSTFPLMYAYYGTEYLGAAHGLSAILQSLLYYPHCWERDARKTQMIRSSIDELLDLQQVDGNFPTAMDEIGFGIRPESDELVHWCHGGPGVIYLMAKAYLYFKDDKYLQSCVRIGELVWHKGLLRKGPGICHGIAGSGYVFLLLFQLTQNPLYLYRARKFAEFLTTDEFQQSARTPDSPYSLYEGWAGTVCYLTDIMQPEKAAFPFFGIF